MRPTVPQVVSPQGRSWEAVEKVAEVFPLAGPVSSALEGALFPLNRHQLVVVARENEAPTTLVSLLYGLPDRRFTALDEVEQLIAGSGPT
jgi:hypothetical protein